MKYTKALGNKICEATANSSIGLRLICEQLKVPYSTVTSWIYDEEHELYNKYARAKHMQLYHLAEEIANIADDSRNDYMEVVLKNGTTKKIQNKETAARTRIRIQARISIITKLAPILYPRTKKKKETHTVTTIPAPVRKPSPESQPKQEKTVAKKHSASSPKKTLKPATGRPLAPANKDPHAYRESNWSHATRRNELLAQLGYGPEHF